MIAAGRTEEFKISNIEPQDGSPSTRHLWIRREREVEKIGRPERSR